MLGWTLGIRRYSLNTCISSFSSHDWTCFMRSSFCSIRQSIVTHFMTSHDYRWLCDDNRSLFFALRLSFRFRRWKVQCVNWIFPNVALNSSFLLIRLNTSCIWWCTVSQLTPDWSYRRLAIVRGSREEKKTFKNFARADLIVSRSFYFRKRNFRTTRGSLQCAIPCHLKLQ
jgi:hypothetical protein